MANNEKILDEEEVANARREFLKKAGKYALYTPPAVMLLMKPSHATFRKSGGYVRRDHNGWKDMMTSSGGFKKSGGYDGRYMRMMSSRRWKD